MKLGLSKTVCEFTDMVIITFKHVKLDKPNEVRLFILKQMYCFVPTYLGPTPQKWGNVGQAPKVQTVTHIARYLPHLNP